MSQIETYVMLFFIFTATFFFGMSLGAQNTMDFFAGGTGWECKQL